MFGTRPQFANQGNIGSQRDIRFGREGGPYMWAWRDFEDFGELVSEIQRRGRQ